MSKKVKWGIIGLGGIAFDFAAGFPTANAALVAVASRNLQHAKEFSEKFEVPKAYGNYHLLMRDPEVEAVYIATPNDRHGRDILNCLKNGKHVFCEKTITLSTKELDEAIALAAEKNLWLAEAMTIYHMPFYHSLPHLISKKELGEVRMVHAFFGAPKEYDPANRFFSKELGGGALYDIGVYALAFIRQFVDDVSMDLSSFAELAETGVDKSSVIQMRNQSDQLASVTLSFDVALPRTGWVIFEKGMLEIPNYTRADKAILTDSDGKCESIEIGTRKDALQYELKNFSETILTGQDHTHLEKTKDVLGWMERLRAEWGMEFTQ